MQGHKQNADTHHDFGEKNDGDDSMPYYQNPNLLIWTSHLISSKQENYLATGMLLVVVAGEGGYELKEKGES